MHVLEQMEVTMINMFLKVHANIIYKNSILFKYFRRNVRSLKKWNLSLSLFFLMAKKLRCFLYWIISLQKKMVYVSRRRIGFPECLNFLVFNSVTEKFVQNVCVFFIIRNYFIPLANKISEKIFLVRCNGFTVSRNCLLSRISFFFSD